MSGPEVSLLPPHVRPTKYRITLAPDLSLFTFAGDETIDLEVAQPTSEIVLNAAEISGAAPWRTTRLSISFAFGMRQSPCPAKPVPPSALLGTYSHSHNKALLFRSTKK